VDSEELEDRAAASCNESLGAGAGPAADVPKISV
jgi:hypothetical protein